MRKLKISKIEVGLWLLCVFTWSAALMAGAESLVDGRFNNGIYALEIAEDYTYEKASENQDFFSNGPININIIRTEDAAMNASMLSLVADYLMDEMVNQYTSIGIPEEEIEREGIFRTEENQRTWLGMKVSFAGMNLHQCITCGDQSDICTLTLTEVPEEVEQQVLHSFRTVTGSNQLDESDNATDDTPGDAPETSGTEEWKDYTLMDGKMQISFPETYDVFISGVTEITDEIAEAQGVEKERLELYLSIQGSDLIAVKEGEKLSGESDRINVRIKPDQYEEIDNFKTLSKELKELTATLLVGGFSETGEYELYETENACFIVFKADILGEEVRYATIKNGAIIYLFYKPGSGVVADEDREILRTIADTVRWE